VGKFESIIEKFRKAQEQIGHIGNDIVKSYPHSVALVEMAKEISTAVTALDQLATSLEEALQDAEQDDTLRKNLMEQIEDSEIYSKLEKEEREKLAEYLVHNKQPLASQDMLIGYVEKSLSQKAASDLLAMYPKAKIIERGKQLDDGSDAFDAYQSGLESYRYDFDTDKTKAVQELAKIWLSRGMDAIAREFYAEALKPQEEVEEDDKD
jgi:hypothetical protein